MIVEVDVWHTGTDAELQQLVSTEPGMPLEGHPDLVCVHAVIEEEAPVAQAKPAPRIVEVTMPDGKVATKPFQDPTPEPMPGRKRARLNYGPRPTK